jgi:hypothetical protein
VNRPALLAAVLFAVTLAGCKSAIQIKLHPRPGTTVHAAAVYPFGFRWDERAYRSFELSQRLIRVLEDKLGEQVLMFGPSEFKVFRPQDDNAWVATNVVSLLPSVSLRAENAVVLRPWAERRLFTSQKELLDAKGRHVGMTTVQETTFIGHIEVLHPSSQEMLVDVSSEVTPDPFAERNDDEADPSPELTRLMERLAAAAADALEEYARAPTTPQDLDFKYRFCPKGAFTYADEGRPAIEFELTRMDPVEAELFTQGRVRFANPGISDADASKLGKLPAGLLVIDAKDGGKVQPGDLLMAIDGQPALPQSLERLRFAPVPAQVKVRRPSGEITEVVLP